MKNYYRFIPVWKTWSSYVGDNSICYEKFESIEDGLEAARVDGTCLREQNWNIYKCSWFSKNRIMIANLYMQGYLSNEVDQDNISIIYKLKPVK